ncbi:hypothetical protein [Roseovarius indicus]|uniref:hypothetical protein n=1 Tax=Roseovarius indicus TaxID=540747 RepID=UPI0007D9DDCE|nr:hypothetical protein [Roseovarius indicus]OAO05903.1 hypothetical protein A8B76_11920 [Roseovarius indicus]
MFTLLLIAILLTLLCGTAWITGFLRNLALFGALIVFVMLVDHVGISFDAVFYGLLGTLFFGWLLSVAAKKYREELKAERREMIIEDQKE